MLCQNKKRALVADDSAASVELQPEADSHDVLRGLGQHLEVS
jgi:hypothetical protein